MYTVSQLENHFTRNNVGYWTIHDGKTNVGHTSDELIDVKDSEKQYTDFLEAIDILEDGSFKVNLFTSQKASASKKSFAFIKGDGGQTSKVGSVGRNEHKDVTNSTSLVMMMMQMMRDSDKKQTELMMMMMQNQVSNKDLLMEKSLAHQEAIHKSQMELEKTKLAANKSNVDKMIGAVTNPNFAKVIGAFQGQPVAVGVAASVPGDEVEPPRETAQTTPSVTTAQSDQNKRLFDLLSRVKGHFPALNPLDTIEILVMKLDEDPSVKEKLLTA